MPSSSLAVAAASCLSSASLNDEVDICVGLTPVSRAMVSLAPSVALVMASGVGALSERTPRRLFSLIAFPANCCVMGASVLWACCAAACLPVKAPAVPIASSKVKINAASGLTPSILAVVINPSSFGIEAGSTSFVCCMDAMFCAKVFPLPPINSAIIESLSKPIFIAPINLAALFM